MIKTIDLLALAIETINKNNDYFYLSNIKFRITEDEYDYNICAVDEINIVDLIYKLNLSKNKSDAKNLIKSGAVEIDQIKYINIDLFFDRKFLDNKILKVGRKFRKLKYRTINK